MASTQPVAYGARPVPLDLTRGHALTEADAQVNSRALAVPRVTHAPVTDQLALAHWPTGHTIAVCGLNGGTGRSTVASLVASALAELPWAHVHRPIALVELRPRALSTTRQRWMAAPVGSGGGDRPVSEQYSPVRTRSGIVLPPAPAVEADRRAFSVVVAEAPVGLPSEHPVVAADRTASVLLVVRPDRRSLGEAAEALVWMHDYGQVHRRRVVVLVNLGAGQLDRGSRAASTALSMRCLAVHKLGADPKLGPMACLPSGTALTPSHRRSTSALCLDLWRTSQSSHSYNSQLEEPPT